jgi:hypothetical protein
MSCGMRETYLIGACRSSLTSLRDRASSRGTSRLDSGGRGHTSSIQILLMTWSPSSSFA